MRREDETRENALDTALAALLRQDAALDGRREETAILACNKTLALHGLALTREEAAMLATARTESLRKSGRVEFGGGITQRLVQAFADSPFLTRENLASTLAELTEIFYAFKNETMDALTDGELLQFMREAFDGACGGSTELLCGRELPRLARQIRQEGDNGAI